MKLRILGTSGLYPLANNPSSSYLLSFSDKYILIDMGSGSLAGLLKLVPPEDLSAIFISHWHFDHFSDLLPLVYYMQGKNKKIKLFAPKPSAEIYSLIRESFILSDDIEGFSDLKASKIETKHPVPCFAYRFEYEGKSLVFTGDSAYFEELVDFSKNADLLLADAAVSEKDWTEKIPHMNAKQAGELAKKARVKSLIITHPAPSQNVQELETEALSVFKNSKAAKVGACYEI